LFERIAAFRLKVRGIALTAEAKTWYYKKSYKKSGNPGVSMILVPGMERELLSAKGEMIGGCKF
jgi:hypothetical protein